MFFSAGEDWIENPETYESSFYKRTLDNDIYIFTVPSFSSKFLFPLAFETTRVRVHPQGSLSLQAFWISSQGGWQGSCSLAPDITLFILLLFPLCLQQSSPSRPAYFLLSALISLADSSIEYKKRAKPATLDWITTCIGSEDRSPLL